MTIKHTLQFWRMLGMLPLVGCVMSNEQMTAEFIALMDARPPEERVPNWETTKALMLREAPSIGAKAPDFTLETCGGGDSIRLSQYEGDRPVVLIFGSWT